MATKTIGYDSAGYYAEAYDDDDGGSGYGGDARVGRWYGSRSECEAVDVDSIDLRPVTHRHTPDPFDLSCEQRND